jgi:hypothetical protein
MCDHVNQIQEAKTRELDEDYVKRFCEYISSILDNLSFEDKRLVLREVVDKIVVKNYEVSIYGIIPKYEEKSCESVAMLFDSRSS